MRKILFLVLIFLTVGVSLGFSQNTSSVSWVNDYTNTLSAAEQQMLAKKLIALERETGSQMVIYLVSTTLPQSIEEYSLELANRLKVGRAEINDGLLLLVAKNDRKVRIEVGFGLEKAIPDQKAKQVIEQYIIPHFSEGDFVKGINQGVDSLIGLVQQSGLPSPNREGRYWLLLLFVPAILFIELLKRITSEKWLVLPVGLIIYGLIGWYVISWQASLAMAMLGFLLSFNVLKFPNYHWEMRRKTNHNTSYTSSPKLFLGFMGLMLMKVPNKTLGSRGNSGSSFSNGSFSGGSSGGFSGGGGSFGGDGATGNW